MKQINTNKEYQEYVNQKSPNSPILKNCFNSFWVGGLICTIGQFILEICKYRGFDTETSATIVSICLIFLSAFLTGLGVYDRIGRNAGAGSIVPITGFANSVCSPSIEFKTEGYIYGMAAKMFVVAGPIIVYGVLAGTLVGILYLFL